TKTQDEGRLQLPGDVHKFDGAAKITATLDADEPCRVLNIMVRHEFKGRWDVQLIKAGGDSVTAGGASVEAEGVSSEAAGTSGLAAGASANISRPESSLPVQEAPAFDFLLLPLIGEWVLRLADQNARVRPGQVAMQLPAAALPAAA